MGRNEETRKNRTHMWSLVSLRKAAVQSTWGNLDHQRRTCLVRHCSVRTAQMNVKGISRRPSLEPSSLDDSTATYSETLLGNRHSRPRARPCAIHGYSLAVFQSSLRGLATIRRFVESRLGCSRTSKIEIGAAITAPCCKLRQVLKSASVPSVQRTSSHWYRHPRFQGTHTASRPVRV